MIRALLIGLALCASLSALRGESADLNRLASAIRLVENDRGRDGAAGERGPYQITAAVWALHEPGKPYAQARQEGPARACALKHLAWLSAGLREAGADANAFNLALAWNAGLGATLRGRAPERAYDYARRVRALYLSPLGRLQSRPLTQCVEVPSAVRTCVEPAIRSGGPGVCLPSTHQRADRLRHFPDAIAGVFPLQTEPSAPALSL